MREAPDVSDDNAYSKNKYLDLPADPEEAFAVQQQREYKELEEMWANDRGGDSRFFERRYVETLVAFDEVHDLGILTAYRDPLTRDKEFSDFWHDFSRHAEITSQKIMMEAARRESRGATNCGARRSGAAGDPRSCQRDPGEAERTDLARGQAGVAVLQAESVRR